MKEWELWMSLMWLSWHEEDSASTSRAFISLLSLLNDYRLCMLPVQCLWGSSSLFFSSTMMKNHSHTLLSCVSPPKFCLNLKVFLCLEILLCALDYAVAADLSLHLIISSHLLTRHVAHPSDTKNSLFKKILLKMSYPVFITHNG